MTPLSERLQEVFNALDTNAYKFATHHGMAKVPLYNILSGKSKPGFELLEKICEAEQTISAEYLLRGEGAPLRGMQGFVSSSAQTVNRLEENLRSEKQKTERLMNENSELRKENKSLQEELRELSKKVTDYLLDTLVKNRPDFNTHA